MISTVLLRADHASFQSVLSNRIFLDIYLNIFFGVRNFGNKTTMRLFFFWKIFEISCRFRKCKKKKMEKNFLVCEITASEIADVNCLYYHGNTCDGQSMP